MVLGGFADRYAERLTEREIDQYERLLDVPDSDLLAWVLGERPAPAEHDTSVFRDILAFSREMTS